MLQNSLFPRILNTTSALSLSAILLGVSFSTPSWSMDAEIKEEIPSKTIKQTPRDFLAEAKAGDVVFIRLLHGVLQIVEGIKLEEMEKKFEPQLVVPYKGFLEFVKQESNDDYVALTEKRKMATGTEFLKPGIEDLNSLLDGLLKQKISVYFVTNSGGEEDISRARAEARSRRDLANIGLDYDVLSNALPYSNPDERVIISGTINTRRGLVIYTPSGEKKQAVSETLDLLAEKQGSRPKNAWIVGGGTNSNDLGSIDSLGDTKFHFLDYKLDKPFRTAGDVEKYIIHRLGNNKFQGYKTLFEKFFSSAK